MRRQYSSRRNGIYADLAALGKLEPHPTPHQQAFPEPYRGKWSAETPAPRWRAKLLSEPQLLGTTVRARRTVANSRSIRLLHQIGRASCRERGKMSVGDRALQHRSSGVTQTG